MQLLPTPKFNMNVKSKLISLFNSLKNQIFSINKSPITSPHILSNIESAIVKSSDRSENPPNNKYVSEILFFVSNSPGSITFLARRLSERLETVRDFVKSVKTLTLIHRLLRGGDRLFEHDLRLLCLSGDLRINPLLQNDDFVMSYSLFLRERIDWVINQGGKLEPVKPGGIEIKDFELVFYNVSKCQVFIDLVLACVPKNRDLEKSQLSVFVLNIVVRESFCVYESFCEGFKIVFDSFFDLEKSLRISALFILRKAVWQTAKLHKFYDFCKRVIIGKNMEFPLVKIVREEEISLMAQFDEDLEIKQMKMVKGGKENQEELSSFFYENLETKISKVWVEFKEGEDDDSLKNRKGMVLL